MRVVTTVVTDDSQGNLAGKVKTMATTTRTSWRTMRLAGASACPSALAAYPSSVKPGNQAVEAVIDGTHFLPARVATPM